MSDTAAVKIDTPHHVGHRDRLRERFLKGGETALADYELLELLLFMAIPRRDVKPLAKNLLAYFGTLSGVFHAGPEEFSRFNEKQSPSERISDLAITSLKTVEAAAFLMMKQDLLKKPVLNSWDRLLDYLKASMAHERKEHFRLLFLNKKNELIADETQQTGTVDHTPAYPREIMKRALELGATAIILVHNHPSGDMTPSQPDIVMTKDIIAAGKPFSIVIHDHLIVSKNGISSMRNLGLI
ncbi:MAG: DNA repair protein RadC [Alphaproteobacteria bacterium]|nr:DNA repair protein RadC [Alphaproteobacteria bacterium]